MQMIFNLSSISNIKLLILHNLSHLGASRWDHSHFYQFSPFSNATVKRTKVSSGGVSDRGGELGLNGDIEKRQLRHISQNFQAR